MTISNSKNDNKGNKRSIQLCTNHRQMRPENNEGKKVKRIREILGIKQEALGIRIGVNQQKMSSIEQSKKIGVEIMQLIAEALKIPVDAIRNFDEQNVIHAVINPFKPANHIENWLLEVKKNDALYEQLVLVEKEKNKLLRQLIRTVL